MAAPKTTAVFSPAFSTILDPRGIAQFLREMNRAADGPEQDAQLKRIHDMSRKDWGATLSLHLHGDLQ